MSRPYNYKLVISLLAILTFWKRTTRKITIILRTLLVHLSLMFWVLKRSNRKSITTLVLFKENKVGVSNTLKSSKCSTSGWKKKQISRLLIKYIESRSSKKSYVLKVDKNIEIESFSAWWRTLRLCALSERLRRSFTLSLFFLFILRR